jgi:hypothetical protein
MPDEAKKPPIFEAAQPAIPGVPAGGAEKRTRSAVKKQQPPYLWMVGGAAIVVVVIALAWWAHSAAQTAQTASVAAPPAPITHTAAQPVERLPVAPGKIATTAQMKEPWSSRKFLYRYANGDTFPAMVVHLHGDAYWAFSLREPYGTCELELASVEKLRDYYDFPAKYPMVGDPCTRTVYDLTRYGNGPNGLVRGAIVAGSGGRPPLAIEVEVQGNEIVASRSE